MAATIRTLGRAPEARTDAALDSRRGSAFKGVVAYRRDGSRLLSPEDCMLYGWAAPAAFELRRGDA